MLTINHKGIKVKVYESIEELPIDRYFKYNSYLLLDAGIGAGLEGYAKHASIIKSFIEAGNKGKALAELDNLTQSLVFTINEINPEALSFIPFIYSIDGEELLDFSDMEAKEILKKLSRGSWSFRFLQSTIYKLKKKIDSELRLFFPIIANDLKTREQLTDLKKRATLILEEIITGEDKSLDIKELDSQILEKIKPKKYDGSNGLEVAFKKSFEKSCIVILHHIPKDPKGMTTLEFFQVLEAIEDKNRAQKKQNRRYA